ncbi:uncharacterized protein LOC143430260 [Xylocopa sonorina]|uniref:uncharacterized protein LOC143430260 n=1 Tax=Xylocopa sonorina TaxID=1818115 RepID=UPI00403AF1D3
MAYFRSKFQIPSSISLKDNRCKSLLARSPSIIQSTLSGNVKYFWSRKSKEQEIQYGVGNCGKPPPPCMDLICHGCRSKCLESGTESKQKPRKKMFTFKKQPQVVEKPSNCKKEQKSVEEKLTWWETIFGPRPERSWPDPCTCRLAHRKKKRMRMQDPRLCDPRYRLTAGDVFLYTEPIKQPNRPSCLEPQPKPPPGYKVPKAVLFRMISSTSETALLNRMTLNDQIWKDGEDIRPMSYRIPYEELRPPERRRKPFNYRLGVKSEDVFPPMNRDMNLSGTLQRQPIRNPNLSRTLKAFEDLQNDPKQLHENKCNSNEIVGKRSRIEQLKILIAQKDVSHCVAPFF